MQTELLDTSVVGRTFQFRIDGVIACFYLQRGAFGADGDGEENRRIIQLFEDLSTTDQVQAVLLRNAEGAFSAFEHRSHIDAEPRTPSPGAAPLHHVDALNRFALTATRHNKVIVTCLSGEVATPFFGLSLATDIRLASPSLSYCLSHVALGVPPSGGLGFLLPRYVGQGLATQWLMCGGTLDAETALRHGLINAVIKSDWFEAGCIEWIEGLLQSGTGNPKTLRRMIYHEAADYPTYLAGERTLQIPSFLDE